MPDFWVFFLVSSCFIIWVWRFLSLVLTGLSLRFLLIFSSCRFLNACFSISSLSWLSKHSQFFQLSHSFLWTFYGALGIALMSSSLSFWFPLSWKLSFAYELFDWQTFPQILKYTGHISNFPKLTIWKNFWFSFAFTMYQRHKLFPKSGIILDGIYQILQVLDHFLYLV